MCTQPNLSEEGGRGEVGFRGEYTGVLKCKRHKVYLKVKYESSGASVGGNQTR